MATTIDARFNALGALGFDEGTTSDRIAAWLRAQVGDPDAHISDAWGALFDQAGIAPGHRNERMVAWLKQQGAAGDALPDLAFSYWVDLAAQLGLDDIDL